MSQSCRSSEPGARTYKVGIDVGLNSVGLAAVEVDESGVPLSLLNMEVFVHDGGVDPGKRKEAQTRRAASGVARRTRRLYRRRVARLRELDEWIRRQGWPITNPQALEDPLAPWHARAKLARGPLDRPEELEELTSVALRHMARHRGWRSPYASVESLLRPTPHSDQYLALRDRVEEASLYVAPYDATPAELLVDSGVLGAARLRGESGILDGKLMQSDNANELRRIAHAQGLDDALVKEMIRYVFAARSPVGSSASRTGMDVLPGQEHLPRASRASVAFQTFRVVSVLANLRIADQDQGRPLGQEELSACAEFLLSDSASTAGATWSDVAHVLGVERSHLRGTATLGLDGERVSARPPVNTVTQRIHQCRIPAVKRWWSEASELERSALIQYLDNVTTEIVDEESESSVLELVSNLSEEDLAKLDKISLPSGRSSYSENSLHRLTRVMLSRAVDLHEARRLEFGTSDTWVPPADPIGAPVGNPAVDRVLAIVARWLRAAVARWGEPQTVNVEHVRSGFESEAVAREIDRANNRRAAANAKVFAQMNKQLGVVTTKRSDLTRYLAIQRQNCCCAYCGETITFMDAEMDHVVPRSGPGATNTRNNLLAVCRACNRSKSAQLFHSWAGESNTRKVTSDGVIDRVYTWLPDPGQSPRDASEFRAEVIARLRQTREDAPIDSRSMESVAWMARELRARIQGYLGSGVDAAEVKVYRGSVTHEARWASGLEKRIHLIGNEGKTRLDRRHHAVDAVVIALMNDSVAVTLAERTSMRRSAWNTGQHREWKEYNGQTFRQRELYRNWLVRMDEALALVNSALDSNGVPVMTNFRLRLGNSRAHEDKVRELVRHPLSHSFTPVEIDRASTPALWCALTRLPDFDPKKGLPVDPDRKVVVNGRSIDSSEPVELFNTSAAAIRVRGGYCELGDSVHHARIYRISGKTRRYAMLRVFAHDLLRHSHEDLFGVELMEQSISVRSASATLRTALRQGRAEYVGWIVRGDEIEVSGDLMSSSLPAEFVDAYPQVRSWRVDGFADNRRLRLRPVLLAAEGLPETANLAIKRIIDSPGWRIPASSVFADPRTIVVRRSVLGELRTSSKTGLPVTWSA